MVDSIIENKSFDFAVDVINVYKDLSVNGNYILINQLLRSGTSIGANVREALRGQSSKDFLSKMYIALKESKETEYWILLLIETKYLEEERGSKLLNNCIEIIKILTSITKTTKKKL